GPGSSFVIKASGFPRPSFGVSPAIAGVTLTDNHNGTATLTAPTAAAGRYTLTITAGNGVQPKPTFTQTFTLNVVTPPHLSFTGTPPLPVGAAPTFGIPAGPGTPPGALKVTESGKLPTGVVLTPGAVAGAASLTGKPAAGSGGTYPVTFTVGTGAS